MRPSPLKPDRQRLASQPEYQELVTRRRGSRPNGLNGRGCVSRRIDLDAALKVGAVFDTDSSARNITDNGAVFCNFAASTGIAVADSLAIDNPFTGVNFRIELRRGTDGECMAIKEYRTVHNAVDLQVFRAGDFSFNLQAGAKSSARAGRGSCRACGGRGGGSERDVRCCCPSG